MSFRQGIRPTISPRIATLPIYIPIAGCAVLYFVLVVLDVWVVRDKYGTAKLLRCTLPPKRGFMDGDGTKYI